MLGCSLAARHTSAANPAVQTVATVKACPVSVQMCWTASRTVPDRRAYG